MLSPCEENAKCNDSKMHLFYFFSPPTVPLKVVFQARASAEEVVMPVGLNLFTS